MTDNELRAHDLALSVYKDILSAKVDAATNKAIKSGKTAEVHIDFYRTCKDIYDEVLTALNRDYPTGNNF